MKPVLYNESCKNVIGVLNNCIECYTEEERNGTFSLTLSYPITDSLHNELIYGRVIQCKPNDEQEEQYFRIYNTERIISGLVHVYALHISFDLAYDYVSNIDIQNQSCEYALNTLFRSSQFSSHYKGYSDIVNAQNYKIQNVNLVDAIAGVKGSIIDTFGTGAEIKRDNTNIYVYNKRGTNTGVKIEYGVNLLNESLQVDISDLTTSIIGTATYLDADGEEHSISTSRIDSPNINKYPHPYILCKDYSDRFTEEEVTENKLINLINEEYLINHVDQPKCSYTIDFVPLSKCSGYEDIEDRIHLCDTVRIIDSRYGIDTEAKVIKYTYNVLTERYETMELGEPRNTLNDVITSNTKGEKGEKGDKGDKGDDGSIGDFPNSLPNTPVLQGKCLGFASIELTWTYEAQVYYTYELYASKTKGFTPTIFDLIHEGQTSSFLYQANPDETWYFKVCAKNTHGARTSFSSELKIETYKIDDMTDYFSNIAIGNAVVNSLTADFMTAGVIKGNWIDAKNLSVTDGNGKRTLDIDSFGNVNLDVASLKISSSNVATQQYAKQQASNAQTNANKTLNDTIKNYYTKTETDAKMTVLDESISLKASKTEVTQAIDNVKVGATNFFRWSNFDRPNVLQHWAYGNSAIHSKNIETYNRNDIGKKLDIDKHIANQKIYCSRVDIAKAKEIGVTFANFYPYNNNQRYYMQLEANTTYTFTYWTYLSDNTQYTYASIFYKNDSGSNVKLAQTKSINTYTGAFQKCSITFTTNKYSEIHIVFYNYYKTDLTEGYSDIYIYNPLVVKGNKEMDWSENPLDIEEYNTKYIDTQIAQTEAEIKLTTDSITQRVSSTESTITTHTTQLGTVDSRINTAKKSAISTASSDATTKADNALASAKEYTTTQITTTNKKVAGIETNLSGITQRVSNVETTQTATNNNVTSLTNRMTSAESKITNSAIVNTVTSSTNWATQTSSISAAQSTATTANATANSALSKANTNAASISTLTTKLTQTESDFNFKIENVGAENLIKNSDFSNGISKWSTNGSCTWHIPVNGSEIPNNYGPMICINNTTKGRGIYQHFNTIVGQTYCVSFYAETSSQSSSISTTIGVEDVKTINLASTPNFQRHSFTFTATKTSYPFVIYTGSKVGKFYVGRVMVTQGSMLQEYRKSTNEIYSTNVKIDIDGIEVTSSNAKTKTQINTNGFVIKDTNSNQDLLKATSSGVVARGGSFYVDDPSNGYTRLWGRDIDINGQRALVGTNSKPQDSLIANKLYINYTGDFKNGTEITGKLTNNGFSVLSDVGSSISQNGYMKLSNGLIIQWGHVTGLEISNGRVVDAHVKYPIDFPNAIITFIPSIDTVDGNNYMASRYNILGKTNNNKTHGWVYSYNWTDSPQGALMDINYIAIGC